MGSQKGNFRQADVKRAIKAARAGGLAIARVEVDGSRFTLIMATGEEHSVKSAKDVEKLADREGKHRG